MSRMKATTPVLGKAGIRGSKPAAGKVAAADRPKAPRPVDPNAVLYTLAAAVTVSGMSRSTLYRHLTAGTLRARKNGRTVLIEGDSLRALMAELPAATFGKAA